jgi:hypothetical protein
MSPNKCGICEFYLEEIEAWRHGDKDSLAIPRGTEWYALQATRSIARLDAELATHRASKRCPTLPDNA